MPPRPKAVAPQGESDMLGAILKELQRQFEVVLKAQLKDVMKYTQDAIDLRQRIIQAAGQVVGEVIQRHTNGRVQYMSSLSVMVMEAGGFTRSTSTVLRKSDGHTTAEYRGPKVYGIIDIILVEL